MSPLTLKSNTTIRSLSSNSSDRMYTSYYTKPSAIVDAPLEDARSSFALDTQIAEATPRPDGQSRLATNSRSNHGETIQPLPGPGDAETLPATPVSFDRTAVGKDIEMGGARFGFNSFDFDRDPRIAIHVRGCREAARP